MKKKLTLLVSLLLCLSMLLASCGSEPGGKNPPNLPPDDPDGGKTPAELESAANALYKAALGEWLKYVEYDAPEANADPEIVKSYLASFEEGASYNIAQTGDKLAVIVKTVNKIHKYTVPRDPAVPVEPTVLEYSYQLRTVIVLDLESQREIMTLNTADYDIGGSPAKYAPDVDRGQTHVVYYVNLLLDGAVIEVSKEVYVQRELTDIEKNDPEFELDRTEDSSWNKKTTYSYYDNAAVALAENLEDRATERGSLIDIAESTYATRDGEIVRKFALGMELPLPSFELSGNNPLCDYFSSGNYHYLVTEEQMQLMPIGDLSLYILPGVSIQILDKEYSIVNEYISDCYAIMGYTVLPNGDVYVCEYEKLESDATEYDILHGEEKLNVIHTVISASEAGKVTTLDKGFVAQKVYTEPMYDVTTPLQQATRGDFAGVCALKDGYLLANVQKFSDGVLSSDSVIAVLNGSLEIVAELPKIIPNQFGYVSFLNEDQALIASLVEFSMDGNTLVYYSVDTTTGDLELFHKDKSDVTVIDGGYIYEESSDTTSVYDYNWNKLYTFDEDESWRIVEGCLLITRTEGSNTYYYTGAIVENSNNNGSDKGTSAPSFRFDKTSLMSGSGKAQTYQGYRFFSLVGSSSHFRSIYNLANEEILGFYESETERFYDSEDSQKYATYNVTRSFTVSELTDGVYCISIQTTWELRSTTGYTDPDENPNPESFSGTSYYIIK